MYSNLDKKLKKLAIVIFLCETVPSIIYGLSQWNTSKSTTIICILLVPILSWISSWVIYALGEILFNQNRIMSLLYEIKSEPASDELKTIHNGEGWLCECGARNTINLDHCNSCDAPRVNLQVGKSKLRNNDYRLR